MANLNIKFNNKNYSIDSASLADATAALEAHLASMVEERLEGDGQEFYTMAPSTLSFRSTAPLNELQEVQINGVTVDPSNYELEEGSTIVKLKYDYLGTLDTGKYELSVVSDSKTVKGDFTVAAPILGNEGFYYNTPYYVNISLNAETRAAPGSGSPGSGAPGSGAPGSGESGSTSLPAGEYCFILGTAGLGVLINLSTGAVVGEAYYKSVGTTGIQLGQASFSGSFSDDGTKFISDNVVFSIRNDIVASDNTCIYILSSQPSDTWIAARHLEPDEHVSIMSLILDKPVVSIGAHAFMACSFESIKISENITSIGSSAFYNCENLQNITFEGTVAQWNAITKGSDWNCNVPAIHVHCTDGDVAL